VADGGNASWPKRALAAMVGMLIVGFARALTGVRAIWSRNGPEAGPTLYFANHSSHADFVLLWATLPPDLRRGTRPVAGEDYWNRSSLRRFIGVDVFRSLLIRRDGGAAAADAPDPVRQMADALSAGDSLIMFPEGTRNTGEEVLLPLKSGLYHLARRCPEARLVPVWIENLKRVLPKGEIIPLPLACMVRFGEAMQVREGETKNDFIARARAAMLGLRPDYDQGTTTDCAAQPCCHCHQTPEDRPSAERSQACTT
jgi:1-acyl-sn-glycerol-3-phosphate acyltransferase